MRKLLVLTVSSLIALTALFSFVPFTLGYVNQGSTNTCPFGGTDTTIHRFCAWENQNASGDEVLYATTNYANLNGYLVTPPKSCAGAPRLTVDWNDCVDSVKVWLSSTTRLCFYVNSSFSGGYDQIDGPKTNYIFNFTSGLHDAMTSWQFVSTSTHC